MSPDDLKVLFKLLNETSKVPEKQTPDSVGYDVYCNENISLKPGQIKLVGLGFSVYVSQGFYFSVDGRSGATRKGIITHRGIIDPDYRGEVKAIIENRSEKDILISIGERVSQIILHQLIRIDSKTVKDLPSPSQEHHGFGSTGNK